MSREFGQQSRGYFHTQMAYAAEDCLGGTDELTRKWGEFLSIFEDIAYAIASSEAKDSGAYVPIIKTIELLPRLQAEVDKIAKYVAPFKQVADAAVCEALGK